MAPTAPERGALDPGDMGHGQSGVGPQTLRMPQILRPLVRGGCAADAGSEQPQDGVEEEASRDW